MERLTEFIADPNIEIKYGIVGVHYGDLTGDLHSSQIQPLENAINKLAEYENTGLTPEEVVEIKVDNNRGKQMRKELWNAVFQVFKEASSEELKTRFTLVANYVDNMEMERRVRKEREDDK